MSAANLLAGLYYAERGWPVFVLTSTKVPVANCTPCKDAPTDHDPETCDCLTCHGFYAGTTDTTRIEAMFLRHPHGLLAIRTGTPSGTVVVDVDITDPDADPLTQPGWQTLAAHEDAGLLPDTPTVITGSGGLHLIYAHPGNGIRIRSGAGRLGEKVDIKADGAYIVAAPSIHPRTKKPYAWASRADNPTHLTPLHPVLVEQLRDKPQQWAATDLTYAHATPSNRMNGFLDKLTSTHPGRRNDMLFWAAKCAGEMVALGQLTTREATDVLYEAGRAVGLTHTEMVGRGDKGTIGSGLNQGNRG